MRLPYRPAGEQEVAVTALAVLDGRLVQVGRGRKAFEQYPRLVVASGAAGVAGHFLQTENVRVLVFDHAEDAIEVVPPIPTADPFVDVVAEQAHSSGRWNERRVWLPI